MMKNPLFIVIAFIAYAFLCTAQTSAPIMLDDIHYYINDREAANVFFKKNFKAKAMKEESENPFQFIDFLLIRPEHSTINISAKGPFPGIRVGDPKRWEKETIIPSPDAPPQYGAYWTAFSTKNLAKAIKKMEKNGVVFIEKNYKLHHNPTAKAAMCWGPDFNRIVLIENKDDKGNTPFGVDYVQLLVKNLDENIKFFEDVFLAKTLQKTAKTAVLSAGNHTFILSEPEDLGFSPDKVMARDSKKFIGGIDHLGFMYKDLTPAFEAATAKGYKFLTPKPVPISYFDKPTLYLFAITFTPDGLQMEMFEEKGRTASRTKTKQ
jgi:catechol 2,3-dioxygenase-like lactoylglutathione lyase family enzyme